MKTWLGASVSIVAGVVGGLLLAASMRHPGLRAWRPAAKDVPVPVARSPLRVLVPAYFYPAGSGLTEWGRLIAAADSVPITAVVNVFNGPGTEVDPAYTSTLAKAIQRGVVPIGYVNTDYGKRRIEEVSGDVDAWLRFYPNLRGFFFDSQATDASLAGHYKSIRELARRKLPDAILVMNPGAMTSRSYFEEPNADATCVFESWEDIRRFRLPSWADRTVAERCAVLPYGVGKAETMRECLERAVRDRIGWAYVTDASGANPWSRLPVYWEDEVEVIRSLAP